MHFAAHVHTVREVIYKRIDADKPNLGLTNFNEQIRNTDSKKLRNGAGTDFLRMVGSDVLQHARAISHEQAFNPDRYFDFTILGEPMNKSISN